MFFMTSFLSLKAQSDKKFIKVTGVIIDQSNNPVQGAHLLVDNKTIKKVSGSGGKFHIKVPADAKKIGVSSNSGSVIDAPINGNSEVTIVIPDSIHKIMITQAESKTGKSLENYAIYTNIYDLLRAKIPGIEVNGTSVRVRGATSFMIDTQPLFVIDGVVIANISSISPSDVATVNLLKGPDASYYGAQGANGVILITLKKGKKA
jgi:TonB-dependent SusC/RagA subfamily outer membrane receptor